LAAARPLAAGKDVSLVNAVPTPLTAVVDAGAFRQVLYNLLDNAIKYGPHGQRVGVGGDTTSAKPGRVLIWVQDQGLGIPSGQEAAIFEPFVRLERDRNSGVAGSGLGLAVVQHLVTAHGGRIYVEPTTEAGTRFVIDLPAA
jgi:signal transduction histidine kinase